MKIVGFVCKLRSRVEDYFETSLIVLYLAHLLNNPTIEKTWRIIAEPKIKSVFGLPLILK